MNTHNYTTKDKSDPYHNMTKRSLPEHDEAIQQKQHHWAAPSATNRCLAAVGEEDQEHGMSRRRSWALRMQAEALVCRATSAGGDDGSLR